MYRKYVRKCWLLKRNRIICPEVAVNEQFLLGKSNLFKIAWKNRNFLWNCLKKIEFFYPDPRPPDFKPGWRCWWQLECDSNQRLSAPKAPYTTTQPPHRNKEFPLIIFIMIRGKSCFSNCFPSYATVSCTYSFTYLWSFPHVWSFPYLWYFQLWQCLNDLLLLLEHSGKERRCSHLNSHWT